MQRFIEVWGGMPELYLLIILSSFFNPGLLILLVLLSLFGWMGLSDYVRAEFLKNRQTDYVLAARAMGVGNREIMWRHILPNSLTPGIGLPAFPYFRCCTCPDQFGLLGFGRTCFTGKFGRVTGARQRQLGCVVDRPVCRCYADGDVAFAGHDR